MGRIWTNVDSQTSRVLLRGGPWNNTLNTGVLATDLNNTTASSYNTVGFRCVR
jgi:hypothetical protein